MSSQNTESLLKDLFRENQKILTICLLQTDGNFSVFLTKKNIDEGEKKRLAASIMASVVLANRSIVNLVQEQVRHVTIETEQKNTVILITNKGNYLYIQAERDFDYKKLFVINLDF